MTQKKYSKEEIELIIKNYEKELEKLFKNRLTFP